VPEARAGAEAAELRGLLRIKWERTELSAPWSVATKLAHMTMLHCLANEIYLALHRMRT